MNTTPALVDLVRASYTDAEAVRHKNSQFSQSQIDGIIAQAKEILLHVPVMPGACALMSAMWTILARDNLNLPVYCVAGDLVVQGQTVWGDNETPEQVAAVFTGTNWDWNGHCWVCFGDMVADITIFRTAYSPKGPPTLKKFITEQFGNGRGLMIASVQKMADSGLVYAPKHVLTEPQLIGVAKGLDGFMRRASELGYLQP